jgi:CxxC motif-containing protein (DUF1111 family)
MKTRFATLCSILFCMSFATVAVAQFGRAQDPGVRQGPAGTGQARTGLTSTYQQFYSAALTRFMEVDSVKGGITGETGVGLGPRFNGNSCAGCHAQPTTGGSSPAENGQIALATLDGAQNQLPAFITANGPTREVRFIRNPDGTPDGGVHDLFVITGRSDAAGCSIQQPDFATAVAQGNAIFRIPTPLFGLGLVEEISDANILANAVVTPQKQAMGISGHANTSANDGTVTKFGWKAQNKSLLMFSGEAYNVEQGVTNEIFPNERDDTPGCVMNQMPEDGTNTNDPLTSGYPPSDYSSDIVNFAMFGRLSGPPTPAAPTASTQRGQALFGRVGCALCHVPSMQTGTTSEYTGQNNATISPYSDFLVHDMGRGLADGVSQGNATGREFRTAPLWGAGQRIFFLHDGRTSDIQQAIEQHASPGSEANRVISFYNSLRPEQQQDLLNFLRSL